MTATGPISLSDGESCHIDTGQEILPHSFEVIRQDPTTRRVLIRSKHVGFIGGRQYVVSYEALEQFLRADVVLDAWDALDNCLRAAILTAS